MINRKINIKDGSFFLFGPRGTGKSYWLRHSLGENALYIDLLESRIFNQLTADPQRLSDYISGKNTDTVVIDEIQKIPALLDEVHRLIERDGLRFILTGSSPRKLRRSTSNLLAGRAATSYMHPLSAIELGSSFSLPKALKYGLLPTLYDLEKNVDPENYLAGYVETYLREEISQEGLTRSLSAFSRFLEAASFSQGQVLNVTEVARECSVHRKVVENYFAILEDLLIASRIPVFTKKAKRRLLQHPKFYFFDAGVYRAIRPKGPLDTPEFIDGSALETLLLQNLRAYIAGFDMSYQIFYWRTVTGHEVDFVLYGDEGLVAIEIKRSRVITNKDLVGLKMFAQDYPLVRTIVLYGGDKQLVINGVSVYPLAYALTHLDELLLPSPC